MTALACAEGGEASRHRDPTPASGKTALRDSLVLQAGWSILLLFSGTFDTLTDTLIFVSWFFYVANAWAVIVLRRREPEAPRSFKVPGYPLVAGGVRVFRTCVSRADAVQRRGRLSPRHRRRPTGVVELRARSRAGFERNTHLLLLPKQQAANLSRDTTPDRI